MSISNGTLFDETKIRWRTYELNEYRSTNGIVLEGDYEVVRESVFIPNEHDSDARLKRHKDEITRRLAAKNMGPKQPRIIVDACFHPE